MVEHIESSNNKGGDFTNGFNLSGLIGNASLQADIFPAESIVFRNCVASNNTGVPTSVGGTSQVDVAGFVIRYPSGATLINCVSEDNSVTLTDEQRDLVDGFADGVLIFGSEDFPTTTSNNIEIRGHKSSRNRVINGKTGCSSGIRVLDGLCEEIVIRDSIISNNIPDLDEQGSGDDVFTAGVDITGELRETPSFISVLNNVISGNGFAGVSNILDNTNVLDNKIQNHEDGVLLTNFDGGLYAGCCSVIKNTFLTNGTAVIDESPDSTSLIADNKGFNNFDGYVASYGVPQETGTLAAYPELATVQCSNTNINKGVEQRSRAVKKARDWARKAKMLKKRVSKFL